MNREFGLLNLMNTPDHCSAPFHSVSSKLAETAKMIKWLSTFTNIRTTCNMVYTVHISDHASRVCSKTRLIKSKYFELGEFDMYSGA